MRTESLIYQGSRMGLDLAPPKRQIMMNQSPVLQKRGAGRVLLALIAFAIILIGQHTYAQLSYSSGRPVWPAYEGWMQNADGTADFLFVYMNENWEEELNVPIGPDNVIEP